MKKERQPLRRPGWALLYLIMFALTAVPGSIPRTQSAGATPADSRAAQVDTAKHLDLATAWDSPPIRRLPTEIDAGHRFIFGDAVTEDGAWLVGSIEPRLIFAATNETPVIALYNIDSRAIVRLHATRTPRSQLLGASADGDWVVWSEATDVLRNADWTMYAYNMTTKQLMQLAQAERLNGSPIAGVLPLPAMDHSMVVWSQMMLSPSGKPQPTVRALDLTVGAAATALGTGVDPAISWPWVAWRDESGRDAVRPDAPVESDTLNVLNMQTREILRVHGSAQSLALDGRTLTICQPLSLAIVGDLAKGLSTAATILRVEAPNHLQDVTVSARLIGWSQIGPAEVWDRLLRVFVRLPIRNGQSATWTHGNMLVWLDPEPPDAQRQDVEENLYPTPDINVIDVATLPPNSRPRATPSASPALTPALSPSPSP